jgi:polysaccharide export outer membrane protein
MAVVSSGQRGRALFLLSLLFVLIFIAGCGDKFWDPTQVGRFRPVPAVNVILDSLGVADETPPSWEGAEPPRPVDVMVLEKDYAFGPGDIIRISIFELLEEGATFFNDYVVTETGKISIIEVGTIQAAGLTETQLEEEIKQILSPGVLKEPSVTVTLLQSEQRAFSIYGDGITRPGRYPIPRTDFRLNDALATAGGIGQFNTSYVYVSRAVTGKEAVAEPAGLYRPEKVREEPKIEVDLEKEMLEIIAPRAQGNKLNDRSGSDLVVASSEMVTDLELSRAAVPEGLEVFSSGRVRGEDISADDSGGSSREVKIRDKIEAPTEQTGGRIEWIFERGKWIPVRMGEAVKKEPGYEAVGVKKPLKETPLEEFGWEEIGTAGVQRRLIEIPADKLRAGDPKYNVVIRPGDSVHVPVDVTGEYFIMGNTNFQGAVNLQGRPLTLKMAIAAAGGLGPLAWPKKCEVIRRIGENNEEIVMVDLEKIASGEQPDFFIKPLDLINVGTHPTSRWRAVLRNAFRATYGFGFIYDRNFADRDYGTSRPLPNWF